MFKNLLILVCFTVCGISQAMDPFSKNVKNVFGQYTVTGSECTLGTGAYKDTPLCVMVHPYNGQPSVQFCADINSNTKCQAVKDILKINDPTPGKFTFSVQDLSGTYAFGLVDRMTPCALKPQWPFWDKYKGSSVDTNVECWAQVFTRDKPASNIIYFGKSGISFHGPIKDLSISPNSHHLNFFNDGQSRCIVYYVKYLGPVLPTPTVRAGLIMLYNDDDSDIFRMMCDMNNYNSMPFVDFLNEIPLTNDIPVIESLFGL
ncbi:MAG: hypothetical protein LBB12_03720 [Holosporaceae bacterium]|jgi:hypothetical protein|nr:hypothetical protein [Holosporaceae bacterium]